MLFLLQFFLALLLAGQVLLRWLHWNPRYSREFVERRQEPLPFAAKLIRGKFVEAGTRLRPLQVEGINLGASGLIGNQNRVVRGQTNPRGSEPPGTCEARHPLDA